MKKNRKLIRKNMCERRHRRALRSKEKRTKLNAAKQIMRSELKKLFSQVAIPAALNEWGEDERITG